MPSLEEIMRGLQKGYTPPAAIDPNAVAQMASGTQPMGQMYNYYGVFGPKPWASNVGGLNLGLGPTGDLLMSLFAEEFMQRSGMMPSMAMTGQTRFAQFGMGARANQQAEMMRAQSQLGQKQLEDFFNQIGGAYTGKQLTRAQMDANTGMATQMNQLFMYMQDPRSQGAQLMQHFLPGAFTAMERVQAVAGYTAPYLPRMAAQPFYRATFGAPLSPFDEQITRAMSQQMGEQWRDPERGLAWERTGGMTIPQAMRVEALMARQGMGVRTITGRDIERIREGRTGGMGLTTAETRRIRQTMNEVGDNAERVQELASVVGDINVQRLEQLMKATGPLFENMSRILQVSTDPQNLPRAVRALQIITGGNAGAMPIEQLVQETQRLAQAAEAAGLDPVETISRTATIAARLQARGMSGEFAPRAATQAFMFQAGAMSLGDTGAAAPREIATYLQDLGVRHITHRGAIGMGAIMRAAAYAEQAGGTGRFNAGQREIIEAARRGDWEEVSQKTNDFRSRSLVGLVEAGFGVTSSAAAMRIIEDPNNVQFLTQEQQATAPAWVAREEMMQEFGDRFRRTIMGTRAGRRFRGVAGQERLGRIIEAMSTMPIGSRIRRGENVDVARERIFIESVRAAGLSEQAARGILREGGKEALMQRFPQDPGVWDRMVGATNATERAEEVRAEMDAADQMNREMGESLGERQGPADAFIAFSRRMLTRLGAGEGVGEAVTGAVGFRRFDILSGAAAKGLAAAQGGLKGARKGTTNYRTLESKIKQYQWYLREVGRRKEKADQAKNAVLDKLEEADMAELGEEGIPGLQTFTDEPSFVDPNEDFEASLKAANMQESAKKKTETKAEGKDEKTSVAIQEQAEPILAELKILNSNMKNLASLLTGDV